MHLARGFGESNALVMWWSVLLASVILGAKTLARALLILFWSLEDTLFDFLFV